MRDAVRTGIKFFSRLMVRTHMVRIDRGAHSQCTVLVQGDFTVGVHAFDRLLLLVEAVQPHLPVWVVVGNSLEPERGVVVMEINNADHVCYRVQQAANKRGHVVSREQRTVNA